MAETQAPETDPAPGLLPAAGTALVLALAAALFLFRLGVVPLLGPDEPRYARVAVEMHRSGDLVTPRLGGEPWLEKPVLYYWLAGAAYGLFGETEAAARLPSVLAGVLLVGATALFGARLLGPAAGLLGAYVCATSLLTFAYARAAAMDMLLAALVTVAIGLLGLRLLDIAGPLSVVAAGAVVGLATLAKGPLGLLLPALVVAGWLLLTRNWTAARRLLSPAAVLAAVLVAGPWYLLVLRAQGREFLDVFLLNHNLRRFTSTIHHHAASPLYYLAVLPAGLFPWSGLVVPALAGLRPRRPRHAFLLAWLLAPLLFFSAAGSKLPGYILPCLPPLAMLAGAALARLLQEGRPGPSWRAAALVGLALGALLATTPFVLRARGETAWAMAVPVGAWALLLTFLFSRRLAGDPAGAVGVLRVGAAGLLLLLCTSAPVVLGHQQSGRDLFLPARGREVLALGAWRTAWMAGYFYNDARVREVTGLPEVLHAAEGGPVLVLCGPGERRRLSSLSGATVTVLAEGVREQSLLKVVRGGGPPLVPVAP